MKLFSYILKKNEKGQGLVEYCLLLAFIAGLALLLLTSGLKESILLAYNGVYVALRGEQPYTKYFSDWRKKSSAELKNTVIASDRLEADQKALALLADKFIGKKSDGVHGLMQQYLNYYDNIANTPKWIVDSIDVNYAIVDNEGWSNVLVPLSYKVNNLDDDGYLWIESNNSVNAVQVFAPDVETYGKSDTSNIVTASGQVLEDSKKKTVLTDRIFYSDGMIANGNDKASDRTVALKVHYDDTGTVDKVHIMAQKGNGNGAAGNWNKSDHKVSGLDLVVTNPGGGPKYEPWK